MEEKIENAVAKRLRDLAAGKLGGEIQAFEYSFAADEINRLETENTNLKRLLVRYRNETPLGHQPHMLAHQVDEAIGHDA